MSASRGSFARRVWVTRDDGTKYPVEQRLKRGEAYTAGLWIRRPPHCSRCGEIGHDIRKCEQK